MRGFELGRRPPGQGGGFADLEFALAVAAGLIGPDTTVVTTVHPLHVITDGRIPMTAHDVPLDVIVTPDDIITCIGRHERPDGLLWDHLPEDKIDEIPLLRRLAEVKPAMLDSSARSRHVSIAGGGPRPRPCRTAPQHRDPCRCRWAGGPGYSQASAPSPYAHAEAYGKGRTVEQVTATRSELLARRAQIDLARRGRDLLEDKREQLLTEFRKIADLVLAEAGELEQVAGEARHALALAEGWDGAETVRSAVLAGQPQPPLRTRTVAVMGARVAEIDHEPVGRPRTGRGGTLAGSSPRLDLVAERFETEVELLLQVAGRELRLRRLIDEIAKTTRRLNALEFVVVPRLLAEAAAIRSVLDERERQDRFRLKRAKERRGRPQEAT